MFKLILTGMGVLIASAAVFWIVKSLPVKPHWAEWLMLYLAIFIVATCELIMLGCLWF